MNVCRPSCLWAFLSRMLKRVSIYSKSMHDHVIMILILPSEQLTVVRPTPWCAIQVLMNEAITFGRFYSAPWAFFKFHKTKDINWSVRCTRKGLDYFSEGANELIDVTTVFINRAYPGKLTSKINFFGFSFP